MLTLDVRIDPAQLQELAQKLPTPELANRAANNALMESGLYVQRVVRDNLPLDTGALRASIRVAPRLSGLTGSVAVAPAGPPNRYVMPMEYGRKPGRFPPIEAIQRWVRRKGLAGRYSIRLSKKTGLATRRRVGKRDVQNREDRAAAFVIARAIARNGSPKAKPEGYRAFEFGRTLAGYEVPKIFARHFSLITLGRILPVSARPMSGGSINTDRLSKYGGGDS